MKHVETFTADLSARTDAEDQQAKSLERRAAKLRDHVQATRRRISELRDGAPPTKQESDHGCPECGHLVVEMNLEATSIHPDDLRKMTHVPGLGLVGPLSHAPRKVPVAYRYSCPNGHDWIVGVKS